MVSDEQNTEIQDTEDTQDQTTASPGRLLKAGREKQRLSQQQVADKLFLKVEQIDDLENDRIDEKTSVTFTRGYIRNYAKQLGLSQEEVIAEFDRLHTSAKQPAKLQSFSRRVAKQTHDDRWMMVTYAIVLTLLAGVVVWWYQQSGNETLVDEAPTTTEQGEVSSSFGPEEDTAAAPDDVAPMPEQAQQRSVDEPASIDADDTAITQTPSSAPETGTQDSSSETQSAADDTADDDAVSTAQRSDAQDLSEPLQVEDADTAAPGGTAAPVEMVFRFADDCWVNIEDSTGEAIAYGIKQAGRVMEISGVPPVEVTLGAPDNVEITVNGEAVDMSVFPGGRTARFSLPIQD